MAVMNFICGKSEGELQLRGSTLLEPLTFK